MYQKAEKPLSSDKDISDPRKISEELKNFYGSLYRRTSVHTVGECFQHLEKLNTPMLTPDEQSLCEGNDGFTKEFYLAFF